MNWINNKVLGLFVKTNGFLSNPLFSGLGHILCFHRVALPGSGQRILSNSGKEISEEKLRFILSFFLAKGYEFINMDQLHERLSKKGIFRKFIVVTFDDGYLDNYTLAYPVFKEMNIPFTIYVSTGMSDHEIIQWPYFLEEYLLKTSYAEFQYNGNDYKRDLQNTQDREIAFDEIRNIILKDESNTVPFFIKHVFKVDDNRIKQFVKENSLSWEQLKVMSHDRVVTIGAHGINHLALSALNESDALEEILGSKKRLEEQLQIKINHFAYPYGTGNEFTVRDAGLVKRAGFKTAVTISQGNIFAVHKDHLHTLPRIPLGNNANKEILDHICSGVRHFSFNGFRRITI
jgi:peptidoglycan/xylan/chitin deacetylase (PgdA/CDA1 family)